MRTHTKLLICAFTTHDILQLSFFPLSFFKTDVLDSSSVEEVEKDLDVESSDDEDIDITKKSVSRKRKTVPAVLVGEEERTIAMKSAIHAPRQSLADTTSRAISTPTTASTSSGSATSSMHQLASISSTARNTLHPAAAPAFDHSFAPSSYVSTSPSAIEASAQLVDMANAPSSALLAPRSTFAIPTLVPSPSDFAGSVPSSVRPRIGSAEEEDLPPKKVTLSTDAPLNPRDPFITAPSSPIRSIHTRFNQNDDTPAPVSLPAPLVEYGTSSECSSEGEGEEEGKGEEEEEEGLMLEQNIDQQALVDRATTPFDLQTAFTICFNNTITPITRLYDIIERIKIAGVDVDEIADSLGLDKTVPMLDEISEFLNGINVEKQKRKETREGKRRYISPPRVEVGPSISPTPFSRSLSSPPLSSPTSPSATRPSTHESYYIECEDDGGAEYGGGDELAVELEEQSDRGEDLNDLHCDDDGDEGDSNEDDRRSSIEFLNRDGGDQPGVREEEAINGDGRVKSEASSEEDEGEESGEDDLVEGGALEEAGVRP
jgi:hypothetical protein